MFQSFDNKLEAQARLLEELQMKIIVSNEEVQAKIASCKETTHAWDKRLSKFDMTLFANESNKLTGLLKSRTGWSVSRPLRTKI